MDYKQLQRNPKMVMSELVTRPDGSVVTKNGCKIYFPVRYADIELAEVGADNLCVGIFPIVVQDKYYSVLIVDAMVSLKPSDINKIKIDEIPYYEFVFEPGSVVIATLDLVQDGKMLYRIYNEFFQNGKIPWFIGYEDLGNILDTSKTIAGADIGCGLEVVQLLASLVARDKSNRTKYYRTIINSKQDLITNPPYFIALKNVKYSATNALDKIAGSYYEDGLISALTTPTERVEKIEQVLRA